MPHLATKGIPCAFNLQKAGAREQNMRNMQAAREKHVRNMRVFPAADYTAPAPFSPSLMGRGYYPCHCHEKVKILQGMYSK